MTTFLNTQVSLQKHQLKVKQSTRVFLSFLSLVLIIFLRRPDLLLWPTLVIEDARIFYTEQLLQGASAIFRPYNSYLHLIPRLIAVLVTFFPTSWAAIVFVQSSVWLEAAAGAVFSLDCYRTAIKSDFLRFLLPIVFYSTSLIGPHLGNAASSLWFGLFVAVLMLLTPASVVNALSKRAVVAIAFVGALISLTQPMCLLLLPYAVWRLLVFKGWSRSIPLVLLIGTAVENGIFFAIAPNIQRAIHPVKLLHQILVAVGNRVILSSFIGLKTAEMLGCNARIAALLLISMCILVVAIRLLNRHRHDVLILVSSFYFLFASLAIPLNGRLDGSQFQSLCHTTDWDSVRYFLVGNMVILFLVFAALDTFPTGKLELIVLLLASLTPALVNNFTIGRLDYNSHWRSHAKEIDAWLSARRNCKPAAETDVIGTPGWVVVLPELRGCHGEVALDGIALTDGTGRNYLADHGSKRLIPDRPTLNFLGVSRIQSMSADELQNVPTGPPVPAVQSKAVINKVTREMFLLQGGKRHYLQNSSTVLALGLKPPFTFLSDALSNAIPLGHMIEEIPNPAPIQIRNGSAFLLFNGVLHLIPDLQTQSDLRFSTDPCVFSEEDLAFLPRGQAIPPLRSNVIEDKTEIRFYLLEGAMRRYIPDSATYAALHLPSAFDVLPSNSVKAIPEGAVIPSVAAAAK